MDIADAWRTLRTNPADTARAGVHLATLRLRPTRHVDIVAPIAGDDELW
jgi:hypothetical protein